MKFPLIYVSVNLYYFRILYKGQVLQILRWKFKRGIGIVIAIQISPVTTVNSSSDLRRLPICISDVILILVCFKRI